MFKNLFFLFLISTESFCQSFLNGDFELNTASVDRINLLNEEYDNLMSNSVAFGTLGNMDILTSNSYCGLPPQGRWYVALTGGGTDAISLKLSAPLTAGETYRISFYDRFCLPNSVENNPLEIGLSTSNNLFGTVIYTASKPAAGWTLRDFSFVAPLSGQFITLRVNGGDSYNTWCHVDNFSFECPLSVNLGNDTTICDGQRLELQNSLFNVNYLWQDNSTQSNYTVNSAGIYWVTVSNSSCSVSDTVKVDFGNCSLFPQVPGAFTPNADGRNDLFRIFGVVNEFYMEIYNRWGKSLFRSRSVRDGWDGRYKGNLQPPGAYIYLIQYRTPQNLLKQLKGTFILMP